MLWTDTLQMLFMLVGFLSVIIKASIDSGGFMALWNKAAEGERIQLLKYAFFFSLQRCLQFTLYTNVCLMSHLAFVNVFNSFCVDQVLSFSVSFFSASLANGLSY